MDRPGTIVYNSEMREFKDEVEAATGFVAYETQPGDQCVWYGTSDKYEDFVEMMADKFNTGTIAYLIDTGDRYMYSKYKDTWYQLN